VRVILYVSFLDAGYAALFSVVVIVESITFSWISMFSRSGCCNDSRQCHVKDVILKLRGYIGLDV